jgi:hypothetical protein
MGYTVHKAHSQQKVSAHRVKHLLSSGGCTGPKKAKGGGVGAGGGRAEKQAEHALDAMHARKDMHEAFAEGGAPKRRYARGGHARGNDSEAVMSAEASPTYEEGVRNSHRVPKKHGGGVGKPINVEVGAKHLHVHLPPHGIPAGPQMAPGAPNGPGPGVATPAGGLPQGLPMAAGMPGQPPLAGVALPLRAHGGRTKAGAFSGVGRLNQFHEREAGGED